MKVLHVITDLDTGGAEMMLVKLLSVLRGSSVKSSVVSLRGPGTLDNDIVSTGGDLHCLGIRSFFLFPFYLWKLRRIVREIRPDIVMGWMYHGNAAAYAACRRDRSKPKLVWNIRQTLYDLGREKRLTRWIIRYCGRRSSIPEKIIYNSLVSMRQHHAAGYCDTNSLRIPNGFAAEEFRPDPAAGLAYRKNLSIAEDAFVVGHAARYHPMKDHETFFKAAAEAAAGRKDIVFVMAGLGIDTDNLQLAAAIDRCGLRDRVHLLGRLKGLKDFMSMIDVLCLTSAWGEGFPNVLGEAMACAVPCIATDIGDCRDIVGETGKIVPPGNYTAIAEGIDKLYDTFRRNRRNFQSLGEKARERIVKHYSIDTAAEAYSGLFEELVSTP